MLDTKLGFSALCDAGKHVSNENCTKQVLFDDSFDFPLSFK